MRPSGYVPECRRGLRRRADICGALRRQTVEKCLEIGANIPRGVLLYQQSGRRVPAKQGQKPGLDRMRLEPIPDVTRNLHEPAAASWNRKNINGLSHRVIR